MVSVDVFSYCIMERDDTALIALRAILRAREMGLDLFYRDKSSYCASGMVRS